MIKSPVLLVDYDGVVLKSSRMSKYITQRCEAFVRRVTGVHGEAQLKVLNEGLYKTYGHTVHGLRSLGYSVDASDFNKYVYDNSTEMQDLFISESDFDLRGLQRLVGGTNMYLYSNAPPRWIVETMSLNPVAKHMLSGVKIVGPADRELLKPEPQAYCSVMQVLKLTANDPVWLIDDSLANVQSAAQMPNWKGIWIARERFDVGGNVTAMRNLDDVFQAMAKCT